MIFRRSGKPKRSDARPQLYSFDGSTPEDVFPIPQRPAAGTEKPREEEQGSVSGSDAKRAPQDKTSSPDETSSDETSTSSAATSSTSSSVEHDPKRVLGTKTKGLPTQSLQQIVGSPGESVGAEDFDAIGRLVQQLKNTGVLERDTEIDRTQVQDIDFLVSDAGWRAREEHKKTQHYDADSESLLERAGVQLSAHMNNPNSDEEYWGSPQDRGDEKAHAAEKKDSETERPLNVQLPPLQQVAVPTKDAADATNSFRVSSAG